MPSTPDLEEACESALDVGQKTGRASLKGLEMKSLPADFFLDPRCQKLQALDLSQNALSTLSMDALKHLSCLTELDLSNNMLTKLPDGLPQSLTALVRLDIQGNLIRELPQCMSCMRKLQMLSVGESPLRRLPAELGELPDLHYVNLDGNKMVHPAPEVCAKGDQGVVAFLREEWQAVKAERLKRRHAMEELKKLKVNLQPQMRDIRVETERLDKRLQEVDAELAHSREKISHLQEEISEEEKFRKRYKKVGTVDPTVLENHLRGISRTDLAAIRTLKKPPEVVQNVLTAVYYLLNSPSKKKPVWDEVGGQNGVRQMLAKQDFISRLFTFQAADLDRDICNLLQKRYFAEESLDQTIASAERASKAIGLLCRWASTQVSIAASQIKAAEASGEPRKTPPTTPPSGAGKAKGPATPYKRPEAPLLGFTTFAKQEKDQKARSDPPEGCTREPLPAAEFELLRNKYQKLTGTVKLLEEEEAESGTARAKGRIQLADMEREAESVLKVLEELDINPDTWDNKMSSVKSVLGGMMKGGQQRKAVFQWWENMAHTHVGYMGSAVKKGIEMGEMGRVVHTNDRKFFR